MATKTLEARFEHLSVKEEKENGAAPRIYGKPKVPETCIQLPKQPC